MKRIGFTVEEAAELLGIGRSLAYQLARTGELPGVVKLGNRYIVGRAALLRALGANASAELTGGDGSTGS